MKMRRISGGALATGLMLAVFVGCTSGPLLAQEAAVSDSPAVAEHEVNSPIDRTEVGRIVDYVRMGYAHWSSASGDPKPDVLGGARDIDDSFGEHKGRLKDGDRSEPRVFELYPGNELTMVLKAPRPGRYVVGLMGMTGKASSHELEYRRNGKWIKLPTLSGDKEWAKGWQVKIFCFLIETGAGMREIPIKIYSTKARLALYGAALAELRKDPFEGKPPEGGKHPSFLFSSDDIPALRKKLTEHPFCSKMYKQVRNVGYGRTMLDRGNFDTPGHRIGYFRSFLVKAAVTSAIDGDQKNRDLAVRLMEKALTWKSWGATLNNAGMIRTMSIAYDCLYEHLSPALRDRIRRRIEKETAALYLESTLGAWWGSEGRANNWQAVCNSGIGLGGLALRGESRYAQDYIDWGKRLCKVYIKTTIAPDGSCREAYGSYFNYGVGTAFSFLVMLKNATGEDLLSYDNDVLTRMTEYSLYLMHPQRDSFCNFDDTDFGYHMNGVAVIAGLAMYKQDRIAQWIVRNYGGEDSGRGALPGWRPWEALYTLLWYDTELEPESPDKSPRTPLARAYIDDAPPGTRRWSSGHVIMRTGFESKDDICLMMQCGDAGGFHGHADQGGFTLDAYGGHLVGDVGKYGGYGGIGNNWAHGPTSHSIVLIDGKSQVYNHRDGDGRKERDGTVDAFVHSDFADYALADSKPAYDAGKNPVSRARRHFLFVRKPNRRGYLVVVDDIAGADKSREHAYTWVLHSTQFHKVVLDEANGAFSFVPSDDNYWNRGKAFEEGGDATLRVLFAASPAPKLEVVKSEKVGGWYDGKPGPPGGTDTFFPPYVKATRTARRGQFAVLLYPESERLGVKMPSVKRIAEGDVTGFALAEDLVLFRRSGKEIRYGEVLTDAELLFISGEGGKRKFLVKGATYLSVGGKKLFTADVPICLALDGDAKGAADGPKGGYTVTLGSGAKVQLKGRAKIE